MMSLKNKTNMTKRQKAERDKTSAMDRRPTEEMSRKQLEEHIIWLREELTKEQEEKRFFQHERDKIQALWGICRGDLEKTQAELMKKCRESREAEKHHQTEISVYQERMKHMLPRQHSTLQTGKCGCSVMQRQHFKSELSPQEDIHDVRTDIVMDPQQNEVELMKLSNKYHNRIRALEAELHKEMQMVRERERKVQKALKRDLAEVKKQKAEVERELSAAQQQNQHLQVSLLEAERTLQNLRKQLEELQQATAKQAAAAAQVKDLKKELRYQKSKNELLLEGFKKTEEERDQLLQVQIWAIQNVQQKIVEKKEQMERKLTAVTKAMHTQAG